MLINIEDIKGEPGTGYENGKVNGKDMGEFECANCHFYRPSNSSCGQKEMLAKSKQPKTQDGRVSVDPEGCCEFIQRLGKVEPGEEKSEKPQDWMNHATWLKK